ncbi:twin-arginine translocase TatA/TatE family subunit [bacterium]|nr:twin-arginine translocase TatA/TatE family subunit [bacterium]
MFIPLLAPPGGWELLAIIMAILLLFGGRKIPEMMKGLGTGIKEFKKGMNDDEDEKQKELPKEEKKNDASSDDQK